MIKSPRIYSCEEWKALPPKTLFTVTHPKYLIIHHTDWVNRSLISNPNEALGMAFHVAQKCQKAHFGEGWADTGQNFTNTREGIILEGRHGSLREALIGKNVRSAHAKDDSVPVDFNDDYGIENEGTYITDHMPDVQWKSLVELCAWLCVNANIDSANILGHSDTKCRTACPGAWLHSQIPRLRREVHNRKLELLKEVSDETQ